MTRSTFLKVTDRGGFGNSIYINLDRIVYMDEKAQLRPVNGDERRKAPMFYVCFEEALGIWVNEADHKRILAAIEQK